MSVLDIFRHKSKRSGEIYSDPTCEAGHISPALAKLRELTSKLQGVPASELVSPVVGPSSYSMVTDRGSQGEIKVYPLYFDGLMRIERSVIPKDHQLRAHYHSGEIQHISLIKGIASIKMCPVGSEPKIYTVKRGRSVYIPAMTPHNFRALEDCYIVNVFMVCSDTDHSLSITPQVVETEFEDEQDGDS